MCVCACVGCVCVLRALVSVHVRACVRARVFVCPRARLCLFVYACLCVSMSLSCVRACGCACMRMSVVVRQSVRAHASTQGRAGSYRNEQDDVLLGQHRDGVAMLARIIAPATFSISTSSCTAPLRQPTRVESVDSAPSSISGCTVITSRVTWPCSPDALRSGEQGRCVRPVLAWARREWAAEDFGRIQDPDTAGICLQHMRVLRQDQKARGGKTVGLAADYLSRAVLYHHKGGARAVEGFGFGMDHCSGEASANIRAQEDRFLATARTLAPPAGAPARSRPGSQTATGSLRAPIASQRPGAPRRGRRR